MKISFNVNGLFFQDIKTTELKTNFRKTNNFSRKLSIHINNLFKPRSRTKRKKWLNFLFSHFFAVSKGCMKALKAFIKLFEVWQRIIIKIKLIFILIQLSEIHRTGMINTSKIFYRLPKSSNCHWIEAILKRFFQQIHLRYLYIHKILHHNERTRILDYLIISPLF